MKTYICLILFLSFGMFNIANADSTYCTTVGSQTQCQTYSTNDNYGTIDHETNYYYNNTPMNPEEEMNKLLDNDN